MPFFHQLARQLIHRSKRKSFGLALKENLKYHLQVQSGIVMLKNTQDSIWYMINVTDIDNVTAAHIHSGILGENGPIVATLFDVDVPIENVNGTLAQGNHTANML